MRLPMADGFKDKWRSTRDAIKAGARPTSVVMTNKKTGYSIMDNVPQITCATMCPVADKCYDIRITKLRPSVMRARMQRHALMIADPTAYIEQATIKIAKLEKKGIDKIRIYTGGDFAPYQMPIMQELFTRFPGIRFYMISKAIRNFPGHAETLLQYDNFFLNLSEMADFRFGSEWDKIRQHPQVNTVYTLRAEETDFSMARASDIVFNVTKAKKAIAKYKAEGLPLCPCDAKDIPSKGACLDCGLCATKNGVRGTM